MARYFFHLRNGDKQLPDDDGVDLPDDTDAIKAARTIVGELFAEATSERGGDWFGWTVHILDRKGRTVAALAVPAEPQD